MIYQRITTIIGSLLNMRFVRDVLTLQAGSVVTTFIAFLKSVAFARLLGLEGFGAYATILAFTGTASIITNLGQSEAALTFFSEQYGKKDSEGMRRVMRYYLCLATYGVAVFALFAWFAPQFAMRFYDDANLVMGIRFAFLGMLAGSFDTLFVIMLQSVREIKTMTFLENLNALLQFIGSLTFLYLGFGITGIFMGIFVSNIIMLCIYLSLYHKIQSRYKLPKLRSALRSATGIGTLFKQGLWISADKNISRLYPQGFLFVLSLYVPRQFVGIAQLAFKVGSLPTSLFLPHAGRMATTVLPQIREAGRQVLRTNCVKIIKHALAVHTIMSIGGLVVLPFLLLFFYGLEYSQAVTPVLWIIIINLSLALTVVDSPLLRLYKKTYIPAVWNAITIPILLLVFTTLVQVMDPLQSFVWIIGVRTFASFGVTAYVYRVLLNGKEIT